LKLPLIQSISKTPEKNITNNISKKIVNKNFEKKNTFTPKLKNHLQGKVIFEQINESLHNIANLINNPVEDRTEDSINE